ncbi:hypothetical protein OLX02_01280 [Novosphingobium sp. KCTC 2891]|uniref:hypothetical protein n=1 Tax=Novosphingobium sp. KCTC 2891 TaxID=2989730 RepID=UPI002223C36E|nr:hypothetical protein [Novosphingobium sp. KCTC 2891]MCW1381445.1 hypothetical protein [Novosphingobium sp. KCTC 2891]
MLLDPRLFLTSEPKAPRVRPTTGERLIAALRKFAGERAEVVRHKEAPWASVTFTGSRHTLVLRFEGWEACDDGENFVADLPEHEFTLPGVLVADAAVTCNTQVLLPEPAMEVEIELLLLDNK